MRFIVMCLLTLGLFGCTKTNPVCEVGKNIIGGVSQVIATQLGCKNVDAVKGTLNDLLAKAKICENASSSECKLLASGPKAKSIIGDLACEPFIDSLLAGAISTIPSEWNCSGGSVGGGLKDLLLNACRTAF